MAARMRFMAAVLAVGWVSQAWAAAEPNQPRRPDAARLSSDERMAMLRTITSDRWMPQDAVGTLERAIRQLELTADQKQKITGILQGKEERPWLRPRKAYADAGKALTRPLRAVMTRRSVRLPSRWEIPWPISRSFARRCQGDEGRAHARSVEKAGSVEGAGQGEFATDEGGQTPSPAGCSRGATPGQATQGRPKSRPNPSQTG